MEEDQKLVNSLNDSAIKMSDQAKASPDSLKSMQFAQACLSLTQAKSIEVERLCNKKCCTPQVPVVPQQEVYKKLP